MIRRPRFLLGGLALWLGGLANTGRDVLDAVWSGAAARGLSFGERYGGNPRSTGNGGQGRGNNARIRRAARKLRNVRARAPK